MSTRCEIVPTDDQANILIDKIVIVTLNQIARDIDRGITLTTSIMVGDDATKNLASIAVGKFGDRIVNGELRLRFREAFGNRLLMYCECIFQKAQAVNNCSGFSLKGELKGDAVKRTAWTMRYSVWTWTGWV